MTVKADQPAGRSQRKAIGRLPDEMMVRQVEQFPESDPNVSIALFALRALAQRVNDRANAVLAPLGLNSAKYNHLVVLYMTPSGMLTPSEISELIHTTNSSVSAIVDTLEQDGLVKRTQNPVDRRSMVVRLTAKGRRRIEEAFPLRHRDAEVGMAALDAREREQLASLLLRVSAAFDNDQ